MGMAVLEKPETTIAASVISRLIQVDEDARVTKRTVAAVAERCPTLDGDRSILCNQVYGETRVDFLLLETSCREPSQTVVATFEVLYRSRPRQLLRLNNRVQVIPVPCASQRLLTHCCDQH